MSYITYCYYYYSLSFKSLLRAHLCSTVNSDIRILGVRCFRSLGNRVISYSQHLFSSRSHFPKRAVYCTQKNKRMVACMAGHIFTSQYSKIYPKLSSISIQVPEIYHSLKKQFLPLAGKCTPFLFWLFCTGTHRFREKRIRKGIWESSYTQNKKYKHLNHSTAEPDNGSLRPRGLSEFCRSRLVEPSFPPKLYIVFFCFHLQTPVFQAICDENFDIFDVLGPPSSIKFIFCGTVHLWGICLYPDFVLGRFEKRAWPIKRRYAVKQKPAVANRWIDYYLSGAASPTRTFQHNIALTWRMYKF